MKGSAAPAPRAAARAKGGDAGPRAQPPRMTPETSLAQALDKAQTVGYLWSSDEVTGYAVRFAARTAAPDGSQRIILITERRLGAWNDLWKLTSAAPPSNYEFSVIELHLNAKSEGEGKASLTGKILVDSTAKTFGLENYPSLPVLFRNVKRKAA